MEIKDLKQHIKELMTAMGRTGMKRLAIKHEDLELELERGDNLTDVDNYIGQSQGIHKVNVTHDGPGKPLPTTSTSLSHEHQTHHLHEKGHTHEEGGNYITSPMVGTYYSSSSPDTQAFVKAGDTLGKDDVVCIIEAMKVMNEIKAGISGTLLEILVSNGDPVEFGTKLFRVR